MSMEDSQYTHSFYCHSRNASSQVSSVSEHVPNGDGSVIGAKYRLMSPAKLPISRSTCITIPPGLSPTSFLESPVLLSNTKAEPSPTTGSFFNPQLMKESIENAASLEKMHSDGNPADDRKSSSFEFHTGSSSKVGLGSTGLVHAGFNQKGPVTHQHPHYPALSSVDSKSADVAMHDSLGCRTANESNQAGQSNNSSVRRTFNESNQGGYSNKGNRVSSLEHKDTASLASTSDDGYNWRKYGQKLVKGSEFPRSYYKCTHPNCEVKKIFERSPSGRITEIVYKGSHDHPKPQVARRQNPGAIMSIQEDKVGKDSAFPGVEDKLDTSSMEPSIPPMFSSAQADENNINGSDSQLQATGDDVEDNPFQKRRKMEEFIGVTSIVHPIREPRVVVQTVSEVDILDDGYRWRKYGQKVVRGNPNPRSYYKCTNAGCPVRKHVERASNDPKAVITTYEGKHNHDVPTARNNSREFAGTSQYSGILKMRPENNNNSISLDLGVGFNHIVENRTNEHLDAGPVRNISIMGPPQIPAYYGSNGTREYLVEGPQQLHPSDQYHQNIGRIRVHEYVVENIEISYEL